MRSTAIVSALALAIYAVAVWAQNDTEQVTLRGYLVDARYASDLQSWENLAGKAKKYTRARGLSKEAKESGFGLVRGSAFYPFDAKGNELALELLEKADKASGISVEVVGSRPRRSEASTSASRKWEPGRDALGRPTYEKVPNDSYENSITLTRRKGGAVKLAVASIKMVESVGAAP